MRTHPIARTHGSALTLILAVAAAASAVADDHDSVAADGPVALYRFCADDPCRNAAAETLHGHVRGKVGADVPGPRPSEYPDFDSGNTAAFFGKGANYIVVPDPGEGSLLDFDNGDALTLEAWVRWEEPLAGTYPYIVGKGRTHNAGTSVHNQNYSLRLAAQKAGVFLSFFFCDAETEATGDDIKDEGHRWTSTTAIPEDGAWHHVAVTYAFGEPDSFKGYIDGESVPGKWDMGGKTKKRPFVDDDELWIGSAMGGKSTFNGFIDEVAIYRTALTAEQIGRHVRIDFEAGAFALGRVDADAVPSDRVRVEIMEGVPVEKTWNVRLVGGSGFEHLFDTAVFAMTDVPRKYDAKALITDRRIPWLLHLSSRIALPAGEYEFNLRSLDGARLYIDGEVVLETPFMDLRSDGHQELVPITEVPEGVLSMPIAHFERKATVTLDGSPRVFSLYRLVGHKGAGARIGELVVGVTPVGAGRISNPSGHILGPQFGHKSSEADGRIGNPSYGAPLPFSDAGWLTFLEREHELLQRVGLERRFAASAAEREYWARRHEYAREEAGRIGRSIEPPRTSDESAVYNDVDRFINARLAQESCTPQPLVDDFSFLRRLALDTAGLVPTLAQIDAFFADPAESRRERAIERFLDNPGWADHWVGYWQDVLAENPGLTKPEINNTGPFRWFIYESFLDNKPFDRFVSELVSLDGSALGGGPAGFGIASQNDVPMAAKAHVIGTAFLGVEMKCARCHDAPYHDVRQQDLFGLAAMLKRGPQEVPGTSSLPAKFVGTGAVKVTLKPGDSVKPDWPFAELVESDGRDIPEWVFRSTPHHGDGADTRERLAMMLTLPSNERFARVIVNRLWQRYLGRALIEPVDDWEHAECSHPDLLNYLARELVTHAYDLKHVAALILGSHTYQRQVAAGVTRDSTDAALFAGPVRRRLTGEQLVDSLYLAAGKGFGSEELSMDTDGRRPDEQFLDLGTPRRAWQFAAVSNERDRPSMSLHVAQSIVDLMMAYGWRQQRQDPVTVRDESPTPLQPMVLANGTGTARAMDLTDDSQLTALALEDQPVETFVEKLFQRMLTRAPTTEERERFVAMLNDGYDGRIVAGPEAVPPVRIHRSPRTWSNHLHTAATEDAFRRQADVERGEAPSGRLDADWRQRAEDAAWVLVNLPEFVFVP